MARGKRDEFIARAARIREYTEAGVWVYHVSRSHINVCGYYIFDSDPARMTWERIKEEKAKYLRPLTVKKVERELAQHEGSHRYRVRSLYETARSLSTAISEHEERVYAMRQRLRDVQREHAKLTGKDV